MDNSIKYRFTDFTQEEYRKILIKAKAQNYEFCFYTDIDEHKKILLLRHDIDISVDIALEIALIENQEDIRSTYFFHMHNEFYNLLERRNISTIQKIIGLGHKIGLHFDPHFYGINQEDKLDYFISFERRILEEILNTRVEVFSFHNTNEFIMGCQKQKYGGLINTYSGYFQQNVTYVSDSNGIWRFKSIMEVIEEDPPKLQILTHPAWWQKKVMSPKEKVWKVVSDRAQETKRIYTNSLREYGRSNIDW